MYHNKEYQPKGIELLMKVRSASLSRAFEPIFGASEVTVPLTAVLEVAEVATGPATGFALADIPILPVSESNNPPTDGDTFTTTSGSTTSPAIRSPIACATINAHTL